MFPALSDSADVHALSFVDEEPTPMWYSSVDLDWSNPSEFFE